MKGQFLNKEVVVYSLIHGGYGLPSIVGAVLDKYMTTGAVERDNLMDDPTCDCLEWGLVVSPPQHIVPVTVGHRSRRPAAPVLIILGGCSDHSGVRNYLVTLWF